MHGKNYLEADDWYPQMENITGVTPSEASFEDFQREYKCKNLHASHCNSRGLQFPSTCSFPPCNRCSLQYKGKLRTTLVCYCKMFNFLARC